MPLALLSLHSSRWLRSLRTEPKGEEEAISTSEDAMSALFIVCVRCCFVLVYGNLYEGACERGNKVTHLREMGGGIGDIAT